ncbi:MAG: hypothetical protein U1F43_16205 [Myxococcota bacterium]
MTPTDRTAPDSFPPATAHGPLLPVSDGVHCVRGTFKIGPGIVISRTMTVVATPDGLVVVSSVRLDAGGEAALAQLGRVAHVVALSDAHGKDDPYYVKTFGAAFWSVPGAKPQGLPVDRVLGRVPGAEQPVPGGRFILIDNPGRPEGALWLPHGGGTLVTCDAIQNHADKSGASFLARVMTPLMGFTGGVIVPRLWRRVHKVAPPAVAPTFAAIAGLEFENLVTAHGPPVIGGAAQRVRAALAALAPSA